jgi:hypothetical protein
MTDKVVYDCKTVEGCDAAQTDLDSYTKQIENYASYRMLPWGLVLDRRQQLINEARARLEQQ